MFPARGMPVKAALLALLAALPFLTACGQKGNPTLRSFEKPHQIAAMRAVHREDEIVLSWDRPAETRVVIQGIEVGRADADAPGQSVTSQDFRIVARLSGDAASYVDKDFRNGTRYLYRLRTLSARNVWGDYSPVLDVTPEAPPPAPQGLTYAVGNDFVEISWDKVAGDLLYNVYLSRQAGARPEAVRNAAPLDENRLRDRVNAAGTVYYSVRAFRRTLLRDEGPLSQELRVDPSEFMPAAPAGLQFVHSDMAVFLLWRENTESWLKGYRVYRKGSAEPEAAVIGFSTTPAFRDAEPLATEARYCVSAQGPAAESPGRACADVIPRGER